MSDERAIKHRSVVAHLQEHRLGAVVLGRRCNFSWYTAGARNYVGQACDVGNSWLVVDRSGARVVTSNIEAPRLREEELAGSGIEVLQFDWHDAAGPAGAIARVVGTARVACDAPVAGLAAPPLGADFDRLRWVLCEQEIDRYRRLCAETVEAVESVARGAKRNRTEFDLAGRLSAALLTRGCLPWTILVGGDERAEKFRHPLPTGQKIRHYFMLVVCAERGGLIANCTRLASFGRAPAGLAGRHQAVVNVDAAMISATRVGATLADVFEQAKAAYAAEGFADQWRLHHQGGSCGYLPREVKAGPGVKTAILADQAFAWNPSVPGTKSEDTILCRKDGCKVLGASKDWPTITGQWKDFSIPRPAILEL